MTRVDYFGKETVLRRRISDKALGIAEHAEGYGFDNDDWYD